MILTSNLEAKYYKVFDLTSKCSHYGIMQPFCDFVSFFQLFFLIYNKHQTLIRLDYFKTFFWEKKYFWFFPFYLSFPWNNFYETEINVFSLQNIASVNFQKVCCSTRSSSQPKVRKIWSLVVVVMSAKKRWSLFIYTTWTRKNKIVGIYQI